MLRNLRAGARIQKSWVRLWKTGERGDPARRPTPGLEPVAALHKLADLANATGGTTGDAGVVAIAVVTHVDEVLPEQGYPEAMEALAAEYESGYLRTSDGQPLRAHVPWFWVVEHAEMACTLARPAVLKNWVDSQAFAAADGHRHELDRCAAIAPLTTAQTGQHWLNVARQLAETPLADRHSDHDMQAAAIDRLLDAFPAVRPDPAARDLDWTVRQLQEEYAHLMAVPLVSKAAQVAAVREQLDRLGARPDERLVEQVRDQLGVAPPPWQQPPEPRGRLFDDRP